MLRVTLEIVPFGVESRRRTIGTLEIANTTPLLNSQRGDYAAELTEDGNLVGRHSLKNWPRAFGAWRLVHAILFGMFDGGCPMEIEGDHSTWMT